MNTQAQATVTPIVSELDAAKLYKADCQSATVEANKRVIDLLPFATAEQMEVVLTCVRAGQPTPEGYRKGTDFKFSPTQQDAVNKARKARKDECADPEFKAEVLASMSDPDEVIQSHTVRKTRDGSVIRNVSTKVDGEAVVRRLQEEVRKLKEANKELMSLVPAAN